MRLKRALTTRVELRQPTLDLEHRSGGGTARMKTIDLRRMIQGPKAEIIKEKVTSYTSVWYKNNKPKKKEYTPGKRKKGDTNGVEHVYKHPTHRYYACVYEERPRIRKKER
jgi:hypothetical protein